MKTSDFYYNLPEELIAQEPLEDRTSSRLLVIDKNTGNIKHSIFKEITSYLKKDDCIVFNNTRVMPARLIGKKVNTSAKIEILLLVRREIDIWEVLVKPGKRAKIGDKIIFGDGKLIAEIIDIVSEGNRIIKFYYEGIFENIISELGEMPLPPYITQKLNDKERYQTVYAKNNGSAAAPTAGLHFTPKLIKDIEDIGVKTAYITLHVGLGTFRPVKVDNIIEHNMHSEYYMIEESQAQIINKVRRNGGRIISVGTTTTRTLEYVCNEEGFIKQSCGWTNIFIYPGYKFKIVDSLITNFHLPESTLIMLVSALAGKDKILKAYDIAVKEKYRFFSFGDAMFITNNIN